ncbi:TPA: ATP-binding protein, partial [Clostridioides difficile]|nr:ATP-binding protein [Clostridioides difficile]
MPESLHQLIQKVLSMRCETQTIEVKAAAQGAPRIYDTLSSFSNQEEGGAIVFGIDEANGFKPCGVYDAQALQKSIVEQCREMEPQIHPFIQTGELDGKTIVVAHIRGLMMGERPAYRRTSGMLKGSYVRVGDADEHMTDAELYEIDAFKKGVSDDVSVHPDAS